MQQQHGGRHRNHAKPRGDRKEDGEVPTLGARRWLHVIVRDGDDGAVVEDGDDHQGYYGEVEEGAVPDALVVLGVDGQHGKEEKGQELDSACHAVNDVVLHPLEDAPGDDDGVDDDGESGRGKDQVGGGPRCVGGALHRNADVCALERRRVVHPVARHPAAVPFLSQRLHDEELVLRKHLREAVAVFDHLAVVVTQRLGQIRVGFVVWKFGGQQDIVAHAQRARRFLGDGHVIACDHLHGDPLLDGTFDGALGVGAGGVQKRQQAHHDKAAGLEPARDGQRTDSALRKILHALFELRANVLLVFAVREYYVWRALHHIEHAPVRRPQLGLRALTHRVKRGVLQLLERVQRAPVHGVQDQGV
mmetsp:Transcript_2737/g.6606  ORF Transcript_2737/g.6606 Transcript_2737/m.6606 type:complete len:361 (-) Transcript_2737:1255-2337(-)